MTPYCPHCGTDLAGETGWKTVGHVEHGIYDGVVFWSCPECGGAWHRWPEGSKIRELAQPLVDAVNAAVAVR